MKKTLNKPVDLGKREHLKFMAGSALASTTVLLGCIGPPPRHAPPRLVPSSDSHANQPRNFNALPIAPLHTGTLSQGVTTFDLALSASTVPYREGAHTNTYGYNGAGFGGPTLVMKKGSRARMQVTNQLAEPTTTHWHGLLVPGPVDGGPHQVVKAGATWLTDAFTVKNNAATYWYHPHMHEMTQKQLTLGAVGLIIVQDEAEAALELPRTYGVDDIPLVLTSRRFTKVQGVANQFQYTDTAYGDHMLSNGAMNAQVGLPQQMVRLRLLNAEVERDYNLGLSDGRSFYVVASDGGLLSAPVAVTRLIMSPGERYEILLDLSGDAVGNTLDLNAYNGPDAGLSFGFAGYEPDQAGEFGSLLNYTTFSVLNIKVVASTDKPVTRMPSRWVSHVYPNTAQVTNARALTITARGPGDPFTFNNVGFNMAKINQEVKLGSTESWTVHAGNIFGHSFHIHGVQFKLVARNASAAAVKNYEQGWKDTFHIPLGESATFVAKFDEAADARYPFMYHCHMVNHEDAGLMGQFVVQ